MPAQARQLLTEMQAVLEALPPGRQRTEWRLVHDEAWACILAETLVPRQRPLDESPYSVALRLDPASVNAQVLAAVSWGCERRLVQLGW